MSKEYLPLRMSQLKSKQENTINTVKSVLKETCIKEPPVFKSQFFILHK